MLYLLKSRLSAAGGAEKYALRLALSFAERQRPITLLTSGDLPLYPTHPLLKIESLQPVSSFSVKRVLDFDTFCLEHLSKTSPIPQTVIGLDRNCFQTHLRASNGVHAAYLQKRRQTEKWFKRLSFEINPLHNTLLRIEKTAFTNPALRKVVVNSHMVRQEMEQFYAMPAEKIAVVHNGVEWDEMASDFSQWETSRAALKEELGLPSSPSFQLLFVGHNYQRKGLLPLLSALSLLPGEDFHLSIVGREKQLKHYLSLTKSLKLENKVHFWGERRDVRRFYALADALVIPSFYDPFANVTIESLAMGVYVISSKANGGSEILTPETGTIAENIHEPESLASLLRSCMQRSKTAKSATLIRASVKHLDFKHQLPLLHEHLLF